MKWVLDPRCQCIWRRFLANFTAMTNFEVQAQNDPPPRPTEAGQSPRLPEAREIGGREGPEPTRFGDWELRGRCIDF
jgi:hypothetical protein